MKKSMQYIMIFIATVLMLFILLIGTAKIPRQAIEKKVKESTNAFRIDLEIDEVVSRRDYTFLHPYADAMLLNIIYCIDTDHPIKSVMEAKYYSKYNNKLVSYQFDKLVENQPEGNMEYIRYWHGSMSIIRPLLLLFNLQQIYIINAIVLAILVIFLIGVLIKKRQFILVIALIIGFIMSVVVMVPFCLEYTWMFLVMLIVSIIAVFIEKKDKKLDILFFITGIITCYFDFLTTEIITILVPVMIVLMIRYKEQRITTFKQGMKFVVKSCMLWFISYTAMWFAKWILASIVLKINAFDYVTDNAMLRVNGEVWGIAKQTLSLEAIIKNFFTLYPLNIQKKRIKLIIIPIVLLMIEAIFIRKKELKKLWISLLLLIIASIPYIRYAILANHSYRHYFFTFRSQIITVMAIVLAIIYSWDKEIVKKEIRFGKKREKNGVNNTNTSTK